MICLTALSTVCTGGAGGGLLPLGGKILPLCGAVSLAGCEGEGGGEPCTLLIGFITHLSFTNTCSANLSVSLPTTCRYVFPVDAAILPVCLQFEVRCLNCQIFLRGWEGGRLSPATRQLFRCLLEKTQYSLRYGIGLSQNRHASLLQNLRLRQVRSLCRKVSIHDPAT